MVANDLANRGVQIDTLTDWTQLVAAIDSAPQPQPTNATITPSANVGEKPLDKFTVSFKDNVAPILVAKCGRCHVQATRGKLSMATYDAIMNKPNLVLSGDPDNSQMISMIESGEMPRGRLKVEAQELATLRSWISQGAQCEDSQRATSVNELAASAKPAAEAVAGDKTVAGSSMPADDKGSGGLVSFSKQVAPVLIESCAACHMDARNVRGGLNLATFASLSLGGDNGELFTVGAGEDSLLVKKLRGTGGGMQMPAGRNPLAATTIQTISQWINEGAKFDGFSPSANLRDVFARARAGDATHEQLAAEREKRAIANWDLVLGGKQPLTASTDNFILLGTDESAQLTRFGEVAESVLKDVAKQLKLSGKEPFVKGKIAAYLFQVRYDYSEFGKMVEKRDLPREWSSHWGNTTLDAYVVFQAKPSDYDALKPYLARHLTAIYLRGLAADVPDWFANGYGIWIASRVLPGDEFVKVWDSKSMDLLKNLQSKDDFLTGQLSDDDAALIGYQFINYLKANGSTQFSKLLKDLKNGDSFDRAFNVSFGHSPQEIVNANSPNTSNPGGNPNNPNRNR